jgi:hypothetical protein
MSVNKFYYDNKELEGVVSLHALVDYDKEFEGKLYIYFHNGDCRVFELSYININSNMVLAGEVTGKLIKAFLSEQLT